MNAFYKDYAAFLAEHFAGKVQKLSIDLGAGCPNRDGTVGTGGCIYCLNSAFSPDYSKRIHPVGEQIRRGREFFARKYPHMRYLAFFQSFTNTHLPADVLRDALSEALREDDIVGAVISTRPDCIPDQTIALLNDVKEKHGKEIFVELGAESFNDRTLALLNRCHDSSDTADAALRLHAAGIPVGLHLILGLPGEDEADMERTVNAACALPVSTLKFHHLQILRGTVLAQRWQNPGFPPVPVYTPESYAALCARLLHYVRADMAIERFVAQAPAHLIVSPRWNMKNHAFTALLAKELKRLSDKAFQ